VLKYEIPPETEGPEVIPWTEVKRVRSASTGHKIIRHILRPIQHDHVRIYVDGLDYIRKTDLGRTLVADYDTVTKTLFAVITDEVAPTRPPSPEPPKRPSYTPWPYGKVPVKTAIGVRGLRG
jgi:hypothetical protein